MDSILSGFNQMGVMALCVLFYGWCVFGLRNETHRDLAIGIVFGIGAVLAMLQPINDAGSFRADDRYVFLTLAAAFGGSMTAATTAAIVLVAQLIEGGDHITVLLGCSLLCTVFPAGWGYATRHVARRGARSWLILLTAPGLVILVTLFLVYPDITAELIWRDIFMMLGILVFGKVMEAEHRRSKRVKDLDQAAGIDFLTQLPNRRALNLFTSSSRMLSDIGRAFVMIDIDHFKAINDRYGHKAGDDVLRAVGARLKELVRSQDFVARTGGEEFALILQARSHGDALKITERIRREICLQIPTAAGIVRVTASAGGIFCPPDAIDPIVAFEAADAALYEAKQFGRNQTVFTQSSVIPFRAKR